MTNLLDNGIVDKLATLVKEVYERNSRHYSLAEKDKYDYVTDLDKTLEKEITNFLCERFPLHVIYGEETVPADIEFQGPTWVIDPLDGTSNFIFGIPFYGCSIAFIDNGKVMMGLVIDLTRDEVFSAFRGRGAFLGERRLDLAGERSDFIGISTGFLEQAIIQNSSVITKIKAQGKFRLLGSQALHLCYVAAGRLKACINYEAKIWDDIAGALIVEEAGGCYLNRANINFNCLGAVNVKSDLFSVAEGDGEGSISAILSGISVVKSKE